LLSVEKALLIREVDKVVKEGRLDVLVDVGEI